MKSQVMCLHKKKDNFTIDSVMEASVLKLAETQANVLKALLSRNTSHPTNVPIIVFGLIIAVIILFVWWDRQDRQDRMYMMNGNSHARQMNLPYLNTNAGRSSNNHSIDRKSGADHFTEMVLSPY